MQDTDRVVVYSRPGCHLCDEAVDILRPVAEEVGSGVRVLNIEDDPELLARYAELIPVVEIDGREVAHWRISAAHARKALTR